MIRNKRRDTEIFSMSFMDCICCGFGAVLLIFILTTGQRIDFSEEDLMDLKKRVQELDKQVVREKSELDRLAESLSAPTLDLQSILTQNASDKQKAEMRRTSLRDLMQQTIEMKTTLVQLMKEKERLPTEEEQPIPIPEIDRRQYLTGIKLDGEGAEFVLFLVRASGSMLGESLDDAINRLGDPDFKKREAPKWQRAVRSIEWMVATLAPETQFNVILFNDDVKPLIPDRADTWIPRKDKQLVREAIDRLRQVVPEGSANMERAFTHVRYMPRLPDVIVLLTDGLPTTSETSPNTGDADDDDRIRFFRYAQRQLPPRIPVSTILFPMTGDPGAPALFWELAGSTRGALVSPSPSWPDT